MTNPTVTSKDKCRIPSGTRDAVETAIDMSKDSSGTWETQLARLSKTVTRWASDQPAPAPHSNRCEEAL